MSNEFEPVNSVHLVGRLAEVAEQRELPSGDSVVTCRVIVPRADGKVDTLDCAAWSPAMRRKISAWGAGDVVEVSGELHRRFWRSAAGLASRYEISITEARRAQRAR